MAIRVVIESQFRGPSDNEQHTDLRTKERMAELRQVVSGLLFGDSSSEDAVTVEFVDLSDPSDAS